MEPVSRSHGLTLIELLVVLLVFAVLATRGLPALQWQWQEHRVEAQARRLLSAVLTARGQAMLLGQTVTLCPGGTGTVGCSGRYSDGFRVRSSDGRFFRVFPGRSGLSVRNRSGLREEDRPVSWDGRGLGDRNLTLSVCSDAAPVNWALVLNRTGRPRLVRHWGSCPG